MIRNRKKKTPNQVKGNSGLSSAEFAYEVDVMNAQYAMTAQTIVSNVLSKFIEEVKEEYAQNGLGDDLVDYTLNVANSFAERVCAEIQPNPKTESGRRYVEQLFSNAIDPDSGGDTDVDEYDG